MTAGRAEAPFRLGSQDGRDSQTHAREVQIGYADVSRRPVPPGRCSADPPRIRSAAGLGIEAEMRSIIIKQKYLQGPLPTRSSRAAADLTREPSRWPRSGQYGRARSQPDRRDSVRAISPYQIHRSVCRKVPPSPVPSCGWLPPERRFGGRDYGSDRWTIT